MKDRRSNIQPDVALEAAAISRGPQEFIDSARVLVGLFERGLNHRSEIAGWHGTSLEAIERTLLLGAFPGSAQVHGTAAAGHLYFYPPSAEDFGSVRQLSIQADGQGGAMRYAGTTAKAAYTVREWGLNLRDAGHQRLARMVTDHITGYNPEAPAAFKALRALGLDESAAITGATQSLEREGVLIALSREALSRYEATDGDFPGEDQKIFVPQGLPLDCIAGIEPLGERELAYFETLQELVQVFPERFEPT